MKPSIAFVIGEMTLGGIPKAGITMMRQLIPYADVSLVETNGKSELDEQVPKEVKRYVIPYRRSRYVVNKYWQHKRFIKSLSFMSVSFLLGHILKRWVKNNAYIAKHIGVIVDEEFDCAICYHGMNIDHLTRTLYNIKAKKKIAWIHGDHPFEGVHKKDAMRLYQKYDKIYFDSNIAKANFCKDFPIPDEKLIVSYCMINEQDIREKAQMTNEALYPNDGVLNILTVGRISPEKGQDMLPEIVEQLKKNNHSVRWYLVGDGPDAGRIKSMVEEKGLTDTIVFIGSMTNPYPYMAQCDIYVQPSYSEAYSLTAFEAAILGRPIIVTKVAGATELLQDGKDSLLVDVNPTSIAGAIERLIAEPGLRETIVNNLTGRDFSNYQEAEKFVKSL